MQMTADNQVNWVRIACLRDGGNSGLVELVGSDNARRAVRRSKPVASYGGDAAFVRIMRKLRGAHRKGASIPAILDYKSTDGVASSIEEYIDAPDINEAMEWMYRAQEQGEVGAMVHDLLLSMLRTLDALHSQGLIHQDVRPENILCDATQRRFVLIDFGLTREREEYETTERALFEFNRFFSPTQWSLPESWDVYALGWTAITLLCGHRVEHLIADEDIFLQKLTLLHQLASLPHVSSVMKEVLGKATREIEADRYLTAQQMLGDLQSRSRRRLPPRPVLLSAFGLFLVLLVVYFVLWSSGMKTESPDAAAAETTRGSRQPVTDTTPLPGDEILGAQAPNSHSDPRGQPVVAATDGVNLTISSPENGSACASPARITGRAAPGDSVWLLVNPVGGGSTWYLNGPFPCNSDSSWIGEAILGNTATRENTEYSVVAIVDPEKYPVNRLATVPPARQRKQITVRLRKE